MFPTKEEYIEEKYKANKKDVEITISLQDEVIETAFNVIKLAQKGINIPFYDIIEMKNVLLNL